MMAHENVRLRHMLVGWDYVYPIFIDVVSNTSSCGQRSHGVVQINVLVRKNFAEEKLTQIDMLQEVNKIHAYTETKQDPRFLLEHTKKRLGVRYIYNCSYDLLPPTRQNCSYDPFHLPTYYIYTFFAHFNFQIA